MKLEIPAGAETRLWRQERRAQQAPPKSSIEREDPRHGLLSLMSGAWATQAIHAAARLGIADHLAGGSATSAELAALTDSDEDFLRRLLHYLVSLGVLEGAGDAFALTDKGQLLRTGTPGSFHHLALLYGGIFYQSFAALHNTVRTGISGFQQVFGMAPFEYMSSHPEEAQVFDRAMGAGRFVFAAVPAAIDLDGVEIVVDIGGGLGELLAQILLAEPRIRGVLVDLPHVLQRARAHLSECNCLVRCDLVAADLTDPAPVGGDVYFLSRILHDWPDRQCGAILRACRAGMHSDASLVIIERLLPDDGSPSLAHAWDINVMVNNVGGRERTLGEYQSLLADSGFVLQDTRSLLLDLKILIARPAGRCH
jgi:hypothetical protein